MAVELNHTIVPSVDKVAAARFLAGILGLDDPRPVSHFMAVEVAHGVTLDYDDARPGTFGVHHYAFLVSDDEFDAIFDRVRDAGVTFHPDPGHSRDNEINDRAGGRGFYFSDPSGHNMEVFTKVPL